MESFDVILHFLVPMLFGGGANMLYNYHFPINRKNGWLQFVTGGFAAMIAVFIINPNGTLFQIAALSAFVGLQGMAWLLNNMNIDRVRANEILKEEENSIKERVAERLKNHKMDEK